MSQRLTCLSGVFDLGSFVLIVLPVRLKSKVALLSFTMNNHPIDPHDIPLEVLFPKLKPEQREEMRAFLDDYAEIAWKVWLRLEEEGWKPSTEVRMVTDIVKRDPRKNAA
jgi:hypothetical protein